MNDYSHLRMSSLDDMPTPELNQLIYNLSLESRERYDLSKVYEMILEEEAKGEQEPS